MAKLDFNSEQHEPVSFELVPPGEYVAEVSDSEIVPTRDETGKRLKLEFTILEGKLKNRKIFEALNIKNKSQEAEQIALGQLSALCLAVGKNQIKDSSDLHNIPLKIVVAIRPAKDGFDAQNKIKSYKKLTPNTSTVSVDREVGSPFDDDDDINF